MSQYGGNQEFTCLNMVIIKTWLPCFPFSIQSNRNISIIFFNTFQYCKMLHDFFWELNFLQEIVTRGSLQFTSYHLQACLTDGQTDRGKTVYPPPPPGSGGIITVI
jgi:hypothetical protein